MIQPLSKTGPAGTRRQEQARKARQQAKARRICTDAVWSRAGGRCESCGCPVQRGGTYWRVIGHVHEIVPRSRGGDPTDPATCVLVCPSCHRQAHGVRV